MLFADMHTHSLCSNDGSFPMLEMARAAAEHGLGAICLTDHCDIERYDTGEIDPERFDAEKALAEYENAKRSEKRCEILLGMELGGANHYPELAAEHLKSLPLDFVIGSVHNLRGMKDFYCLRYESEAYCRKLLSQYVDEHFELERLGAFDVLGHIGYPLRYMREQGFSADLSPFFAELEELFLKLRDSGKGIELNSSGLRGSLGCSIPSLPLLKLYREKGGEIITVGSDAHEPAHVGANFADAKELLDAAGFRYYCIFMGRKPDFIKI